jgi:hypothetical protein
MNLVSLIVVLILLALFAGAMYVGYQKFVVQGGLFETPTEDIALPPQESSFRTPGEVPGGVSGVDNMRGRPKASVGLDGGVKWYGTSEKLVSDGEAKTADVCKNYSSTLGIKNWGWDRQSKSCFAYVDSSILSAMADKNNVDNKSKYIVGCTEPGVKVYQGCLDLTKGDVVWGYTSTGGERPNGPGADKVMSFEACRAVANDEGYDAFGYRTNRHDHNKRSGSCFYYSDPEAALTGWFGNFGDKSHMSACVDPSKKVSDGCQ